jgi:hypothetical protein
MVFFVVGLASVFRIYLLILSVFLLSEIVT